MPSAMVALPRTPDAKMWQNALIFFTAATEIGRGQVWIIKVAGSQSSQFSTAVLELSHIKSEL